MSNIKQFLVLSMKNGIISDQEKDKLLELHQREYLDTDLYKKELANNVLDEVMTFAEAAEMYDLAQSTLRRNLGYDRYLEGETRKSGGTWLITVKAAQRLYPNRIKGSMNNFKQFLELGVTNNIISDKEKDELLELCIREYPGTDLYKEDLIDNNINTSYELNTAIDEVMTFKEATEKYGLYKTTLRKNVDYERYLNGEVRQSKGTWLITKKAVERLYSEKK